MNMSNSIFSKNSYVIVLVSLVAVIFLMPLLEGSNFIITVLFSFPLVAGIYASMEEKPKVHFGLIVGVTAFILNIIISWDSSDNLMIIVRF